MAVNSETLYSLVRACRDTLNEPTSSFFSDDEIKRWLNQAMLKVVSRLERLEKEETVAMQGGTAGYSLSSDHQNTLSVQYVTSGQKRLLAYISPETYRGFSKISQTSIPTHYTIIGESLYIWQTPSGSSDTVSHRYTANPQKMESDSDVPYNGIVRFFPYHLDIVNFAAAKGFAKRGELDRATYFERLFSVNVSDMLLEFVDKKRGCRGQMRRMDEFSSDYRPVFPRQIPES